MNRSINILIIGLALLGLIAFSALYTINERELAIKFQLGEFVSVDGEPGLKWKIPFIQNVRKFERRIITLDAQPERYLTLEKKNVIVDAFIKWRISDVSNYYKTMAGDERNASMRLQQVINDGLRAEFGKRTIQEAISGERGEIMRVITDQIAAQVKEYGIEVVDVRIKRIELPRDVSDSVYQRMRAERDRVAKELRSEGAEIAEKIRAEADRQRSVIIAEAYREAEGLRGEGDARASEIYAQAYGKDPQFYALYRSLDAYKRVFDKREDMLVLDPSAEFFKYFGSATGK